MLKNKIYLFWNLMLGWKLKTSKPLEAKVFIYWDTVTIQVYKNSCHPFRGEKALNFISTLVLSFRCDSQINSESSNIPSRFVLSLSHIYYRKCIRFVCDRIMYCICMLQCKKPPFIKLTIKHYDRFKGIS